MILIKSLHGLKKGCINHLRYTWLTMKSTCSTPILPGDIGLGIAKTDLGLVLSTCSVHLVLWSKNPWLPPVVMSSSTYLSLKASILLEYRSERWKRVMGTAWEHQGSTFTPINLCYLQWIFIRTVLHASNPVVVPAETLGQQQDTVCFLVSAMHCLTRWKTIRSPHGSSFLRSSPPSPRAGRLIHLNALVWATDVFLM